MLCSGVGEIQMSAEHAFGPLEADSARPGTMNEGMIFDIKRYAIHDGPGIRTTVFFKGCPLNCPWCQNPEGKSPEPELIWRGWHCIGCEDCLCDCPEGALSLTGRGLYIDRNRCSACGLCLRTCHSGALEMAGKRVTVDDLLSEIQKDSVFYDESDGGVTFSGGEPLMQPGFLVNILRACRARGIATAVDTSGYVEGDVLKGLMDEVDLFLWDLKIMDDAAHKLFTGVSNSVILENLKAVRASGTPTVVRFSLIPGINDDEANVKALGNFVSSLEGLSRVDILPYHKAGVSKAERLGRAPAARDHRRPIEHPEAGPDESRVEPPALRLEPPALEALESVRDYLTGLGLEVRIGG